MRGHFFGIALCFLSVASAADTARTVTANNFNRAESDLFFANTVKEGGFGKFMHNRQPTPLNKQVVVRMNRDTLYSAAVFDLDAGPVTVTLPDAGKRFMSMQIIDEDQYAPMVVYAPVSVTLSKDRIGTRYVMAAVRTLADPNNPKDIEAVQALQDAINVDQPGGPGVFQIPDWDAVSQKKVRTALAMLAGSLDSKGTFGPRGQVDPVKHLIGTAVGWGGNPEKDAFYTLASPKRNDGITIYKLTMPPNVPVDGFWSITVYDAKGYFEPNRYKAYSVNDITAKKNADGSVNVQFGGCDGKIPNCLPIMKDWNYTMRLYRPRPEILDGMWKVPEAQPAP
jgi:hypothetical protein